MDRIVRLIASDAAAATYQAADAHGRRLIYTVGNRPVSDRDGYEAWARTLMDVARTHRRIVDVTMGGVGADGRPFLVSATAESTLAELLSAAAPPSTDVVVAVIAAAADALDALHARGIRHEAVCPSTILLDGDGRILLAGFDTRAPQMALPAVPGPFTAPEGPDGAPSDVYCLAATGYAALGGVLPYAAAPADPGLRRQQIAELTGVPPQVTAVLRAAMHPDPHSRPTAGQVRDALSTLDVPGTLLPAVDPARLGAPVRPVNESVVAINGAVAAAAAAGIAATAGIAAGKAAGALLPQAVQAATQTAAGAGSATGAAATNAAAASGVHAAGAATAQAGAAGAAHAGAAGAAKAGGAGAAKAAGAGAAKAGMGTGAKVGIGVVVAALVAGAAFVGVRALNGDDPIPGTGTDAAFNDPGGQSGPSIKDVDFNTISFVEPNRRGETVQLSGGTFTRTKENQYDNYTYTITSGPVYADLDGDGDLDAALVLELKQYEQGYDTAKPFVFAWTWDGGKATLVPNVGHGTCTVTSLTAVDGGVEVAATSTGPGLDCRSPQTIAQAQPETFTVAVRNGVLVQVKPGAGAADRCTFIRPEGVQTLIEPATPTYLPKKDAPAIEGQITTIQYDRADTINAEDAWVIARLTYADGTTGCGWIQQQPS